MRRWGSSSKSLRKGQDDHQIRTDARRLPRFDGATSQIPIHSLADYRDRYLPAPGHVHRFTDSQNGKASV